MLIKSTAGLSTRWARRSVARVALLCTAVALSACTTLGSGTGSLQPGAAPVNFAWKSTDGGITGTMSATLSDGRTFTGPYLEITSNARSVDLTPMWIGWRRGWADWPGWGLPDDFIITQYSGRATANLQATNGERMRCSFYLNQPNAGMGGGGQGQCQLANGRSVDAVFPAGGTSTRLSRTAN